LPNFHRACARSPFARGTAPGRAAGPDRNHSTAATNGASFQSGLPEPGSIGTIFCTGLSVAGTVSASGSPLPMSLAGVSVTVGGAPAPLFAVAVSQGALLAIAEVRLARWLVSCPG